MILILTELIRRIRIRSWLSSRKTRLMKESTINLKLITSTYKLRKKHSLINTNELLINI